MQKLRMMLRCALMGAGLLLARGSYAQVKDYNFRQISLPEGLSQSSVFAIEQDDDGFMWFGTQDGLNKYDGYMFKVFKKYPFDSTSLNNSHVTDLLRDKAGNLWIGTAHGLNLLPRHSHRFVNLSHLLRTKEENGLIINRMLQDSRGIIWIGTDLGLVRLVPQPGTPAGQLPRYEASRWVYDEKDSSSLSDNAVSSLLEDQAGNLWIGTRYGVNRLSKEQLTGKANTRLHFDNPRNSKTPLYHLEGKYISSMVQDRFGLLWLGTGRGLYRAEPATGKVLEHFGYESPAPFALSHSQVSALLQDRKGILWVGTYGGGINKVYFDATGRVGAVHQLQESIASFKGYRKDFVLSIYESREEKDGSIWFGMEGGGIGQFNPSKNNFKLYQRNPLSVNTLSENNIFSVLKDREGNLWVGSSRGLNRLDPRTKRWTQYFHDPDNPRSLLHDHVGALFEDQEGTLWVGTLRGLNRYDRQRDTFLPVKIELDGKPIPHVGLISALHVDRTGQLWIGTTYDLIRLDRQTLRGKSYGYRVKNSPRLSGGRITCIYEDRQGVIWVGTYAGLNRYDRQKDAFAYYVSRIDDRNSLSGSSVFSLLQARDGAYWIATDAGLNKLTFPGGKAKFEHYTEKEGLPNNFIYGVLEDEIGRIWLSTNLGLSVFDPRKGSFFNYDVDDGLQSKEFNSGAYYRAENGEMFFGGINGLNSFFPDNMVSNQHVPRIKIVSLYKFKQPLNLDSIRRRNDFVELNYNDNFFSFEFVALDYANPLKNQYAYQLEGFDKDWIYCGTRHYASFTNLDPGEYVFKVKGSNDSGVWNHHQVASIRIIIRPPFWMTWWFYLLSLVVVLLLIKVIHDVRVRRKLRHVMELEKIRTTESERIRRQTASDFHDEMGNRITRIGVLTELIKVHLNGNYGGEVGELLSKISDNCNTLYNGTRDFIWSINPDNNSFFDVAVRLKDFGDELFDNTSICFTVGEIGEELKDIKLPMDWSRQLILIFKEALNNVLKHAHCTHVHLQFKVVEGEAIIQLNDDGQGFEFGQNKGGTGLTNMTNRARKINSKLLVSSTRHQGTKIIFTGRLPQNGGVLV